MRLKETRYMLARCAVPEKVTTGHQLLKNPTNEPSKIERKSNSSFQFIR